MGVGSFRGRLTFLLKIILWKAHLFFYFFFLNKREKFLNAVKKYEGGKDSQQMHMFEYTGEKKKKKTW